MSFLSTLEEKLERIVKRLFSGRDSSGVHPIEIAKALVRSMETKKSLSVQNVYVPNAWTVILHPEDLKTLAPIRKTIERDIIRFCSTSAQRRGYHFPGPITLSWEGKETLSLGSLAVEVSFDEDMDEKTENMATVPSSPLPIDGEGHREQRTQSYPAPSPATRTLVRGKKAAEPTYVLWVFDGPDKGKMIRLNKGQEFIIGRATDCDLVLTDGRVSKVHAKVHNNGIEWRIEDLNSTNGTFINGKRMYDEPLIIGDDVVMGVTSLRFMHEEQR